MSTSLYWCKKQAFGLCLCKSKNQIRQHLKQQRNQQDQRVARYKSEQIASRVLQSECVQSASTIAAYYPIRGEVSTIALLNALLEQGKTIVLPCVQGDGITFFCVNNLESDLMSTGAYGIQEPNRETCKPSSTNNIDLFLTPGVGFDLFGGRIGFGGGYYDRMLSEKRPDSFVMGLAYDFQVQHALSIEPHDQLIDCIISEKEAYTPMLSSKVCPQEVDTQNLAITLCEKLSAYPKHEALVIALHGNLGTGKTVFVNGMAKALNTVEPVVSPTFVYCREYHGDRVIYHIDGYRLDSIDQNDNDFWAELFEKPGIIVVEWAERFGELIPKDAIHVFGTLLNEFEGDTRREWVLYTALEQHQSLHNLRMDES